MKFSTYIIIPFLGFSSLLLGGMVIFGWYAHIPILIQVHPSFAPMQYNTALGFIFGGAGLIAAYGSKTWITRITSGFLALLGSMTLIQYMFGVDFGIDQLLMDAYITVETSHPGRMAPNTAFCFLLTGISFLILGKGNELQKHSIAIAIIGGLVFALGLAAFGGYLISMETAYGWSNLTRMAVHTASEFILIGLGIVLLAWKADIASENKTPKWAPILVGMGALTITLLLWQAVVTDEVRAIKKEIKTNTLHIKSQFISTLESLTQGVTRLTKRWEVGGAPAKEEWLSDAGLHVEHHFSVRALEWVDADFRIRWVAPLEGNEAAEGLDLSKIEGLGANLMRARNEKKIVVSSTRKLVQGGKGFFITAPIFHAGQFQGFIHKVVDPDRLLSSLTTKQKAEGIDLVLVEANTSGNFDFLPEGKGNRWLFSTPITFHGNSWRIVALPKPQWLKAHGSMTPTVVLVFGVFASFLLAQLAQLVQKNKDRTLKAEMAEAALQDAYNSLDARAQSILVNMVDPLITINDQGRIEDFNPAAERTFGYSRSEVIGKNVNLLMPEPYHSEHDGYLGNYRATGQAKIIGSGREVAGKRKDGSVFPLDLAVNEMKVGDKTMFIGTCRDITERRQAEQRLRDSEEKFNQLAKNIHEVFWIINAEVTEMIYISDAYETVWGRSCEDLMNNIMDWGPSLHPEDSDRVLGLFNFEDLAAGNFDLDYRIIRPDGSIRWIHAEGLPVRNDSGDIFRFAGIAQDITERKQAEEKIARINQDLERQNWVKTQVASLNNKMLGDQDSVELAQNIINVLAEILEVRIGSVYLVESDKLKMTAGFAHQENVSKTFEIGEGLVGQAVLEKQSIVISDVPKDHLRVTSGLGDAVPTHIMIIPFLHEDIVMGVAELGSFSPFSDRQWEFLNQAGEGIAIALNSALARKQMTGLLSETQAQSEELIAQREEMEQIEEELRQSNQYLEEQTRDLVQQKGEVEKKGGLLKIKMQELKVANKYKSEFLANMSHELRTPLNSMLILSQLLAENKRNNLTEKQVEFAQTIHSSGADLLDLINDILDLSKVEAGKMEIHVEEVSLTALSASLEKTFLPVAKQKGLEFKTQISAEMPSYIQTDFQRAEQILKNFLSNAFKFTEEGNVTLKFHPVESQVPFSRAGLNNQNVIGISVSDTGKGITRKQQDQIFEAFRQEDGTTSRKYGGTGLGLSISKELVRLLGGEIQLSSEEGMGSAFTVYLPEKHSTLETEEDRVKVPVPLPKSQARHPSEPVFQSILVIEDDPRFAKIVSDAAKRKGFDTIVAGDGELGLELAEKKQPTAIILDEGLPGIDGLEVMRQLQANAATRGVPVYFISANHEKAKEALTKGATGFLKKPVDMEKIESIFTEVVGLLKKKIKQILVVEDDEDMRKSIIGLLDSENVNFLSAATVDEAIQVLRKHEVDCMTLDLGLGDKSGFDLLHEIKIDETLPKVPVIIYTAMSLTQSQEEELAGFSKSIIVKGARSPERLLDEINAYLYGAKQFLEETDSLEERDYSEQEVMEPDPTPVEDEVYNFQGKKVLLTDDDMRNVFALTHLLEEKEADVIVARNGREAIDILKSNPDTDLILMDIMMPEMDGYTAIRKIRKDKNFRDIPIIAITAKAMKTDKEKCLNAGASDYLAKPVDQNKLFAQMSILFKKTGLGG